MQTHLMRELTEVLERGEREGASPPGSIRCMSI